MLQLSHPKDFLFQMMEQHFQQKVLRQGAKIGRTHHQGLTSDRKDVHPPRLWMVHRG